MEGVRRETHKGTPRGREATEGTDEARQRRKEKTAKRPGRSIAFVLSGRRVDVIIYDVVNSEAKLFVTRVHALRH